MNRAPVNAEVNAFERLQIVPGCRGMTVLMCLARAGVNTPETMFPNSVSDNLDVALHRVIALSDSKSLEFRAEVFNVFKRVEFFGPGNRQRNVSSSSFGWIVSADAPREMQLAAKFYF
jgi:hypothetical protein